MLKFNETHQPELQSWLESANTGTSDFPIQNLPFAVLRRRGSDEAFRGAVAIGDQAVDLAALHQQVLFSTELQEILSSCCAPTLNHFMGLGLASWSALRLALSRVLRQNAAEEEAVRSCLIPLSDVEYQLPCQIGDYTDFYTSIHHATAVGSLFRPDNPLLPNYKWVPIGYHGRSSSIAVSGQQFHRPKGQLKAPDQDVPVLGACKRLDYELEMGIYVGQGNELGEAVTIDNADQHLFGMGLFNDWSARDIQAWEYQPLGPFLAKNFASTLSPWIITMEALLPYRKAWDRDAEDPQPLEYLDSALNRERGAVDIELEVLLETPLMRDQQADPVRLSRSNFKDSYWTVGQMLAHHTVNGCNMRPGDLLGSGTQSGAAPEEAGSMLELSKGGKQPLQLTNGEQRTFLEDGDRIIMRGWCQSEQGVRIGFGEVSSQVLPAR